MREQPFGTLRVERPAMDASTRRRTNHNGNARAPAVTALGRKADNLIVAASDEIGKLHFRDRPQAHQARADGGAHNRRFSYRSVDDAALPESLEESGGNFERAS